MSEPVVELGRGDFSQSSEAGAQFDDGRLLRVLLRDLEQLVKKLENFGGVLRGEVRGPADRQQDLYQLELRLGRQELFQSLPTGLIVKHAVQRVDNHLRKRAG